MPAFIRANVACCTQAIDRVAEKFVGALKASLTKGDDLDKHEFAAMLAALGIPTGAAGGN
jgi:hypothetical protein